MANFKKETRKEHSKKILLKELFLQIARRRYESPNVVNSLIHSTN